MRQSKTSKTTSEPSLEPRKLSKGALAAIERPHTELLLSSASLWEIGMGELPFHHRDPFDRILIAQALRLKATVIGKVW